MTNKIQNNVMVGQAINIAHEFLLEKSTEDISDEEYLKELECLSSKVLNTIKKIRDKEIGEDGEFRGKILEIDEV